MITMMQSTAVRDGKGKEGFMWAVKVTKYLNDLVPGHQMQTLRGWRSPLANSLDRAVYIARRL
ncbi:MAG: hypothetical protein R2932_17820 [Caldilineaceae bacterium]